MEQRVSGAPLPARRGAEALVVFALVFIGYALLLSEIPVDDVQRYIIELQSDRFHWDLGHVWMQPLALLAYRVVGGWLGIIGTLELVNLLSVALGAAIFFDTLRRLGHATLRCGLAVAFVVLSFNLLSLGPTAHVKLMVFPALALSLRHAVFWENALAGGRAPRGHGLAAGLWLGVAANLLVSVLPAALFVAMFMGWRTLQTGADARRALLRALPFVLGVAVAGAALLLGAYAMALATGSTSAPTLQGFVFGGIREKQDLHLGFANWREVPLRFVFSLIYNFVFLPSLGGLGRAWLWGWLPGGAGEHAAALIGQGLLALLSLTALSALFGAGLQSLGHRAQGLLLSLGYVLGAAAFSAYYNLNDPEHWFQFTLPLAFIAVHARQRWLDVLVLGVWLPVLAVVNLSLYAIPKATFALEARQTALRDALGAQGLYVGFGAYPGEPDTSLFELQGREVFNIDLALYGPARGDVELALRTMDTHIDAALARGGRVLVFRALDPGDWRGPVIQLAVSGLTRDRLRAHLAKRYRISGPIGVAGFDAWELSASSPQ